MIVLRARCGVHVCQCEAAREACVHACCVHQTWWACACVVVVVVVVEMVCAALSPNMTIVVETVQMTITVYADGGAR